MRYDFRSRLPVYNSDERRRLKASLLCAFIAVWAVQLRADEPARQVWSNALLSRIDAWPHSERDAHITVTPQGLRVAVPDSRDYAIAAISRLAFVPAGKTVTRSGQRLLLDGVVIDWHVPSD